MLNSCAHQHVTANPGASTSRLPLNYPTWYRAFLASIVVEVGAVALIALLWLLFEALGLDLNVHAPSTAASILGMFMLFLMPATMAEMMLPAAWPDWMRWATLALMNLGYLTVVCYVIMGWRAWQRPRWPAPESSSEPSQ